MDADGMHGNGYSINLAEFSPSANLDFVHISSFYHIVMSYEYIYLPNVNEMEIGKSMKWSQVVQNDQIHIWNALLRWKSTFGIDIEWVVD